MTNAKQNGNVNVEAIQMLTNNVSAIVEFLGNPNTEVVRTKLSYKNMEIVTVMVPCYNIKTPLRHKDYVIKYTEGKDISFIVISEDQYKRRYETITSEVPNTSYYNGRVSPWGY